VTLTKRKATLLYGSAKGCDGRLTPCSLFESLDLSQVIWVMASQPLDYLGQRKFAFEFGVETTFGEIIKGKSA
jgi:hypothetical protein